MENKSFTILVVILIILVFYLLSVLSSILIPLVLAFLLASLFQPIISFFRKIKIPDWLFLPVVVLITMGILFGVFQIIYQTVNEIGTEQDYLVARLESKIVQITQWAKKNIGAGILPKYRFNSLSDFINSDMFKNSMSDIASGIGSFGTSFLMFSLYYIVILVSMPNSRRFIEYVAGDDSNGKMLDNFESIQKSIISYISVKTFISILNGLLTFIICYLFDIRFPFFWGFLGFVLNYIPNIGPILAVFFPVIMGLIQFDSFEVIILIILLLTAVHFTLGNIIEPIVQGNALKLNTITIIFGLVFWGYIWGISGMLLAVPLLVIFKLIFEQIPELKVISRIMGSSKNK